MVELTGIYECLFVLFTIKSNTVVTTVEILMTVMTFDGLLEFFGKLIRFEIVQYDFLTVLASTQASSHVLS